MATEHDDAPEMGGETEEQAERRDPETGRGTEKDKGRRQDRRDDPDEGKSVEELKAEKARMAKALKDANDEARKKRLKLEEYERAEEERKAAGLSETEKVKNRLAAAERKAQEAEAKAQKAEARLRQNAIDAAVERAAREADFLYPELVPRQIDAGLVEIDEETGKVTGAREAVARLIKLYPDLVKSRAGGGTPPRDNPQRRPGAGGGGRDDARPDAERLGLANRIDYNPL
jgi:hypothetical protein